MEKKKFVKSVAKSAGIILGVLAVIVASLLLLVTHDFKEDYKDYDTTNTEITE